MANTTVSTQKPGHSKKKKEKMPAAGADLLCRVRYFSDGVGRDHQFYQCQFSGS